MGAGTYVESLQNQGRVISEHLADPDMCVAPKQCVRALTATNTLPNTWDTSTYFDIWQAFVAIKGMCTRYRRLGTMTGLGTAGKLRLDILPFTTGSGIADS